MSLTKHDLQAIKTIVGDSADELRIEVANGFAEVHERIDDTNNRINTVEHKLSSRVDGTEQRISSRIDAVEQNLGSRIDEVSDTVSRTERKVNAIVDLTDRHDKRITRLEQNTVI